MALQTCLSFQPNLLSHSSLPNIQQYSHHIYNSPLPYQPVQCQPIQQLKLENKQISEQEQNDCQGKVNGQSQKYIDQEIQTVSHLVENNQNSQQQILKLITQVPQKKIIFILFLQSNNYFVGKAANQQSLESILKLHYQGISHQWTSIYKPLQNFSPIILADQTDFDQYRIFYQLVNQFGQDHVRGGIYQNSKLMKHDNLIIQRTVKRLRGFGNARKIKRKKIINKIKSKGFFLKLHQKLSNLKQKLKSTINKFGNPICNIKKWLF